MDQTKPRKAKVKLTRTVTEIAIVYLDRDGNVDEFEETIEELDYEVGEILEIRTVITIHD